MKKVLLVSGSRHTIPPLSNSPGVARIIQKFAENEPDNCNYTVISKYDASLNRIVYDKAKYVHPLPSVKNIFFEFCLEKLIPYRLKKKLFGFTLSDRIIYYYGIKKMIRKIKPAIIVTFMHVELFKILQQEYPKAKHIYFYRSTDLKGRLGNENINFLLNNADGFLANTQSAVQELKKYDLTEKIPSGTIYNATKLPKNTEKSSREIKSDFHKEKGLDKDAFILGYAGRFSEEKSLLELLQAIYVLKQQQIVVHLVIAGDIKNEKTPNLAYYNKVMTFVAENLQSQVHFMGWVSHKDLFTFYSLLDTAVLLSKYREGNSMFLIEALSVGVPAIATNIGGNVEILKENETGFLIDLKTMTESLVDKIGYLQSNKNCVKRMSENAISYVEKNHSYVIMTDKFNTFIKQYI